MRSFPPHLTQTPFRRLDRWVDHQSGAVLWPALWLKRNQEKGLSVHYTTLTLGLGLRRWRWTWGIQCDLIAGRMPGWDELGGDAFLDWARTTFGGDWPRGQAQQFFRKNPRWRDLVVLGGMETYYIRILLAREMMRAKTIENQASGLDGLADLATNP
jgi:hypothetical protein